MPLIEWNTESWKGLQSIADAVESGETLNILVDGYLITAEISAVMKTQELAASHVYEGVK